MLSLPPALISRRGVAALNRLGMPVVFGKTPAGIMSAGAGPNETDNALYK